MRDLLPLLAIGCLAFGCSGSAKSPSDGDAGAGGDGQGGGANGPGTSNGFVTEIRQTGVDKIDLLLMIDNSRSMADKQVLLAESLPVLISRLIQPLCVDAERRPTGAILDTSGGCATGEPEFPPIRDIHIGVVTSSLGAHGGQVCTAAMEPSEDDKGRLLPSVRPGLPSWNDAGFLAWDPDPTRPRNSPPGESNAEQLTSSFQDMVTAAGQSGCGYEASLEAWYRFLIDPDPPSEVGLFNDPVQGMFVGTRFPDETILAQRAAFLRPDSLVGIIMLSDENDCSVMDSGHGFLVGLLNLGATPYRLPRSTSMCQSDPNSPCCVSCGSAVAPAQCGDVQNDPECARGAYTATEDHPNLRCFDQKRRFGIDLLYPIERYLAGLTESVIYGRELDAQHNPIARMNPLFTGAPPRDPAHVFLAGIVGVPWQDISTAESWTGPELRFLTYQQMVDEDRWSLILGSPGSGNEPPTLPGDPLMIETDADRSSLNLPHPLLGGTYAPQPPSAARGANPVNGHESDITDGSDLQYACTFPLDAPRACSGVTEPCDCQPSDAMYNRSICDGTTQTHAKAYPGLRQLRLLQEVGQRTGNSVVASICPKNVDEPGASYGYTPAIGAIVERFAEALRPACFPRAIERDASGRVGCSIYEAWSPSVTGGSCPRCGSAELPGRSDLDARTASSVRAELRRSGRCDDVSVPCDSFCACELQQHESEDLLTCQRAVNPPTDSYGFCYVDPATQDDPAARAAEEAIVAGCPVSQRRRLRFTGNDVPMQDAVTILVCQPSD